MPESVFKECHERSHGGQEWVGRGRWLSVVQAIDLVRRV